MVHPRDEIYSKENTCSKSICNNIDESRKQGLGKKKKKSQTEEDMLYNSI